MLFLRKMFVLVMIIFFCFQVFAADTLMVDPGNGTLNSAIDEHGGNKIYKLEAGKWYGIDGSIEHSGYHLQIVGEETNGMLAILQNGTDESGQPFDRMFNALGDLTLKNLFLVNQTGDGQIVAGDALVNTGANVDFNMDNCVLDPVGKKYFLRNSSQGCDVFVTNSKFYRQGHQASELDATIFVSAFGKGFDTVWVENSTFLSTGTSFFQPLDYNKTIPNFIWINHNTFIHHKWFHDWNGNFTKGYYLTNNLFFDYGTFPFPAGKPFEDPLPDGSNPGNSRLSAVQVDTLPEAISDSLGIQESERKAFVEYNMQYMSQKIYDILDSAKVWNSESEDLNQIGYLYPLVWSKNTPAGYSMTSIENPLDSSRTARIFADEGTYAQMKFGNMMWDVDPQWTEDKIYDLSDSFAEWTKLHAKKAWWNGPVPEETPDWHWDIDGWNEVDPAYYPQAWPRFDGSYNNPDLQKASIAGLPLGDLNHFPDKKEIWENHKQEIQEHIMNLNESQLNVVDIEQTANQNANTFSLSKNYPNPFNPITNIKYTVKKKSKVNLTVYNVLGQKVKQLVNNVRVPGEYRVQWDATNSQNQRVSGGIYFYKLETEDFSATNKMLLLK
jgi:hypothetical protein